MTDNDISKYFMLTERYLHDVECRNIQCMIINLIKSLNTLYNNRVKSLTQAGIEPLQNRK